MEVFDTVLPADSVEFCPGVPKNIFACGTYKVLETPPRSGEEENDDESPREVKPQKRVGKCLIFEVESGKFQKIQEFNLPAILDMKWCHRSSEVAPILGIADSEGHVTLHQWLTDRTRTEQVHSISCAPSDVLCLSLDWSQRRFPTSGLGPLIVSLSNGNLSLLQPHTQDGLVVTDSWHSHDYEPWIAAWNYWDTNVVYSGGDDCKMKGWDIRQGFNQPTFVNKRFDAGVTTIQNHPHVEHIIAVGSYDSSVRLFDTRKPLMPLTQAKVGGGAWRVKWHPSASRKSDLLVACMHDGCKIVRFNIGDDSGDRCLTDASGWEIMQRFDKHESMAYGVDWSFDDDRQEGTVVASCSFYDHVLHMWRA